MFAGLPSGGITTSFPIRAFLSMIAPSITLKQRIAAGRAEASHDDKTQDQSSRSITHLKQRGGRLTNPFVVVALAGEPEADVFLRDTSPNLCSFLLLDTGNQF